jgi:hypothetical protein
LAGAGIAGKSNLKNRRKLAFRFHDSEHALCELLGAADSGVSALYLGDPAADIAARGGVQLLLEPASKRTALVKDTFELGRHNGYAFLRVGLHTKLCGHSGSRVAAALHAFVDDHRVAAFSVRKKRRSKSEAVDFAFYTKLPALSPNF